ncbi:membrane protein insertase YidC [Sphingomonas donggukensis]|uniref:Membrane protein insertase YidC n=1 Tax=Sphingomonas donggukensis TaxID=2949093 RepID=A0ABY4TXD8_9SPHN|nr:membrane protein insertase YidC [Sphingomonas donggukensis]URW76182.1 membrane protein insertase YidC [Sphingomonas donggukensis]
MNNDKNNFVLFAVFAALILFGWPYITRTFFPAANPPVTKIEGGKTKAIANPSADPTAYSPAAIRDRNVVLAEAPRVRIETPTLKGSINLRGPRIDDLILTKYDETIAKDSAPIRLLSPSGTQDAYFAGFGWRGAGSFAPPAADAVWQASGTVLTPSSPVTLTASNATGQRFAIRIAVDQNYMFTVTQTVANAGTTAVPVAPYSFVNRTGVSKDPDSWTIHTGPMASHGGAADYGINFKDIDKAPANLMSKGGWYGFVDKYWLTAAIPDQGSDVTAQFRAGANKSYQADYTVAAKPLAPGAAITTTARFFAGAKEVNLLDNYEDRFGITHFGKAIDWGWFEIIEKPIFKYLDWLFRMIGNFGVAIILLTFTVRLIMFPIAQKQFASMASMRAIQPKLKTLQEKYKDDKPRLQQEMMALYKTEKVNPLAGCAPTLLQIPIFYALYKVLMLTIEMRHQPFVAWIKDLSAPDPLTPVNLFGLLAFTPPHFIAIGVVPILLGISMYFQFKLNPAPMDDTQKQIFGLMPWVLMFVMAPFAVGLQVYWITSNLLTIAQQQWLYSRHPALKTAPAK